MSTLWEKISKANDAACAILKAILNWDVEEDIDAGKRRLFNALEEAKNQITTDLFLKKDEWAPAVMREFGNSMDSERAQKSVRYMARVNLATFTIAIWTGTDLRQILAEFFPYVIPQNYEYVDKLLRTFLEISSWVAANECCARLNEDAYDDEAVYIDDILQDIFHDNLKSLDLSDEDSALATLEGMFTEKYNWIMKQDPAIWIEEASDANVRKIWTNMCYDIMANFDYLFPTPNTQVSIQDEESDDDTQAVKSHEKFINEEEEQSEDEQLKEQSEEQLEEQPEEEQPEEQSEELSEDQLNEQSEDQLEEQSHDESEDESNKVGKGSHDEQQNNDGDSAESSEKYPSNEEEYSEMVDELEADEEDYYQTPSESLDPDSGSQTGSPPTTGVDLKRITRDDDQWDSDDLVPKLKRPRVTAAIPSQQDIVLSFETFDDTQNTLPDNTAPPLDNELSTADLQQTPPPTELHPSYVDENLPHGLPRTVNIGPASPIPEDDELSEHDTTYREILQATTAEIAISVGSVPVRNRRDLPLNIRRETVVKDDSDAEHLNDTPSESQQASAVQRGPFAHSSAVRTHTPSSNQRPGRKRYTPWSNDELAALEEGLAAHGAQWSKIKTHCPDVLAQRTNVQLKDKARTEYAAREKAGLDLGVYACISPKFSTEQINQRIERTARNRQHRQRRQLELEEEA